MNACENHWSDCSVIIGCEADGMPLPDVAWCKCGTFWHLDDLDRAAVRAMMEGNLAALVATSDPDHTSGASPDGNQGGTGAA